MLDFPDPLRAVQNRASVYLEVPEGLFPLCSESTTGLATIQGRHLSDQVEETEAKRDGVNCPRSHA